MDERPTYGAYSSTDSLADGGRSVTIDANINGIRRYYYRGTAYRLFHAAEFDFTNPVHELIPASEYHGIRPNHETVSGSSVNETAGTFDNPLTGETVSFTGWTYDYGTRSYALTLPDDGGVLSVAFGDEQITVTNPDGTAGTADYAPSGAAGSASGVGAASADSPTVFPPGIGPSALNRNLHTERLQALGGFQKQPFLSGLASGMTSWDGKISYRGRN